MMRILNMMCILHTYDAYFTTMIGFATGNFCTINIAGFLLGHLFYFNDYKVMAKQQSQL